MEKGEDLQQAVIREVKEETGYVVKVNELHSVREAFFQDKSRTYHYVLCGNHRGRDEHSRSGS
ncbi:NUDIX domain-containing protein [Bacillus safensis]|uniref:NUDIX domain-containing protein n=1 Tax=Bacillus safensis TaxID=561879 RepID=UPI0020C9E825|nr:NUDIX domain-containing protein [Bacillus safensis]MCP8952719.1 NUDIX domain-containing protein [Bacillus safensis]MCU0156994.1 NUDIX domain-containing protein [Bacillus safensis]